VSRVHRAPVVATNTGVVVVTTVATLLLAEDDRAVRESLVRLLEFEGYRVVVAADGAAALEALDADPPDAVLLDVNMPYVDGLTVCRRLRARGDRTPVLVLTARETIADRVEGLDAGADDYLAKPYAPEELLARVRALLRRTAPVDDAVLAVGGLALDPRRRTVERDGTPVELTKTEFELLELLLRNVDVVLERSTIYERVWGYDFGSASKSLDVHIGYLRRKTEPDGAPRLIHTIRGVGYVLRRPRPG
jgi:two-component system response regulator MprA